MTCKTDPQRRRVSRTTGIFLLLLLAFCYSAPPAAADLLVGTGEAGSFSYFAGRTLCRAIEGRMPDIDCEAVPAPDDLHNLTNLRIGSLDLILVDAHTLQEAIAQSGAFRFLDFRFDSLRTIVRLYEVAAALVVRSDAGISSLAALPGKRVNLGTPGSPQHRIFSAVMNAKGWSAGDFSLVEELTGSQSVDALAFCHGTIQAMLRIGVHPDAELMQLTRLCGARLIDSVDTDVDNLIRKDAVYSQVAIAAGTYPTQPQGVSAIGTRVLVIASADLGERTAYRIIEAMADGRRRIESAHPALAPFDETSGAGDPLGIMLHPGVSQFLDERRP